jgi:hypothetical protein
MSQALLPPARAFAGGSGVVFYWSLLFILKKIKKYTSKLSKVPSQRRLFCQLFERPP